MDPIALFRVFNNREIVISVKAILEDYCSILPADKLASIVIKPNLNSNMNALTGNTTDLRLLSAIVQSLKERGYENITIAEGTNSGFHRQGINVIRRLKVDALAASLGVKYKDTNSDDTAEISFEDGVKVKVAKTFLDADFFVNVPKLKMHYETEMSACLKSLIGCLAGMQNKQKTHYCLIKNICNLNEQIKPHLQILDAVIAMEGTGPTTGTPITVNVLLAGTNPYILDLAAASIAHVPLKEVPVLVEAQKRGKFTDVDISAVDRMDLKTISRPFKRPVISWLTAIVTNKKLQKYFQKIRHAPGIGNVFDKGFGNKLLFKLGVTQEVMINNDMGPIRLSYDPNKCNKCGTCIEYCPMGKSRPDAFPGDCIQCMYCYSCCPQKAININGELGFFKEQIKQYDQIIRLTVNKGKNIEREK